MVSLKDDLSLRELGERFGVTPGAIMNAFRRNGIERKHAPPGPRKHRKGRKKAKSSGAARAKAPAALPPEPGDDGLIVREGTKDAQIAAHGELLGKVPDREVATKAGVSLRSVAAFRARNDIAGYSGPRKAVKRGRRSKVDPFADEVGTVPDRVIADKAGVSVNAVRNWRRVRGISAFNRSAPSGAAAASTPAATTPARTAPAEKATAPAVSFSGSGFAWRVTLDGGATGVVLGANIAEAGANASKAGAVLSVERVGALL